MPVDRDHHRCRFILYWGQKTAVYYSKWYCSKFFNQVKLQAGGSVIIHKVIASTAVQEGPKEYLLEARQHQAYSKSKKRGSRGLASFKFRVRLKVSNRYDIASVGILKGSRQFCIALDWRDDRHVQYRREPFPCRLASTGHVFAICPPSPQYRQSPLSKRR